MYTYDNLEDFISRLNSRGIETGSIGRSVLNNELFFVHLGSIISPQVIITGGIHARENGTCALVARQVERMIGKNPRLGFYFLPMLNPDGALLLEKGAMGNKMLLKINGSDDFGLWKANAAAVDLNVNFPALWGSGKGNRSSPASHGYIGEYPLSEPETRALCEFTMAVKPVFTVSYHELGREVYWYFHQPDNRDRPVAKKIADFLGYKLVDGDLNSAGGYKDWCILNGFSAVTIEVGSDELSHPAFEEDIEEDILLLSLIHI